MHKADTLVQKRTGDLGTKPQTPNDKAECDLRGVRSAGQ